MTKNASSGGPHRLQSKTTTKTKAISAVPFRCYSSRSIESDRHAPSPRQPCQHRGVEGHARRPYDRDTFDSVRTGRPENTRDVKGRLNKVHDCRLMGTANRLQLRERHHCDATQEHADCENPKQGRALSSDLRAEPDL